MFPDEFQNMGRTYNVQNAQISASAKPTSVISNAIFHRDLRENTLLVGLALALCIM